MTAAVKSVAPSVNGWNADYLDAEYTRWKQDPSQVSPDLRQFFEGFDLGRVNGASTSVSAGSSAPPATGAELNHALLHLVNSYRELGHLCAAVDPFGRERPCPDALLPQYHRLTESNLDDNFTPADIPVEGQLPLREIIELLDETYCRSIGVEYMHIQDSEQRKWFIDKLEGTRNRPNLSAGHRVHILWQLHKAELFETFLHKRYVGQKRFSLEGGESLIPLLDRIAERAADLGVDEIVLGMPHRGRLNVLNNILGKTYEQIFTEFESAWDEDFVEGGGDVKYHLGYSGDRQLRDGREIRIVLSSNPSHLESVNGVVEGRCRAKQRLRGDVDRTRVIPVLLHGDAAFIGQGAVQECLNFSQLEGYRTGGTIHVIVNNLIGFTTGPEDGRSSAYCSDVAKMIDAPIFHVNGEDPEAVVHVASLAAEYRTRFGRDVVIDLWCYRKWGHNEGDDPSFTQPLMAKLIKKKPSVLKTYAERLLAENVITEKDVQEIRRSLEEQMDKAQSQATKQPSDPSIDPGSWRWQGFGPEYSFDLAETGVSMDVLKEVAAAHGNYPEGFNLHRNLKKILDKRAESVEEDHPIDWGTGEAFAFGSMLLESVALRLSGQDSRRGTFSQRHACVKDQDTAEAYIPLNHMRECGEYGVEEKAPGTNAADGRPRQARLCVYDSPLSEEAVLGFEYGYSLADPNMLVMWEAQFGDFANSAQVLIDQFIASAEVKWQRWCGLTLLLPHGYEGQGPEHSSARMERFLQLCADDNMQVAYPSTPSQYFHLLRRQVARSFRKPLIVMTPKSLLRLPEATSAVREFTEGGFREILDDPAFEVGGADRSGVKRLILCCGKVYYDLDRRRRELGTEEVAIVRVEQLYPLHTDLLEETLAKYPKSAELIWAQEEPKNAGGYGHFSLVTHELLGWSGLPYVGRDRSATPATGSKKQHDLEQKRLVEEAINAAVTSPVGAG